MLMQLHRAALIGLALLVPAVAAAQAPGKVTLADLKVLEGTWILDVEKSGLTQAETERRVMSSGPAWLRVDLHRAADAQPVALIYNLDGSSNVNAFGAGTAITKLAREGEQIVLDTVFTVNNQAVTLHERVPLVPGLNLPIETMLRVEHGYQGVPTAGVRTPPNISNVKKIFTKQQP
jgi:hypothetical protein